MSRLDELIAELCPDGVKYEPLWKVTIWDKKFNGVDRCKQPCTICYPYLLANELFDLEQESGDVFLLSTGERVGFTTEELAGKYICEGEIVAIPWGKSRPVAEVIKYYNGKFVTTDNRIVTSINKMVLSNKFLFYWMTSEGKKIDIFYRGSGIKHPSMKDILEMRIPIPPLPVQEEIVRILDKFTELTAELTAELAKRKQQYQYYRDIIVSNTSKSIKQKIGDICLFKYGKGNRIPKGDGIFPVYGSNGVVGKTNEYNNQDAPIIGHIGSAGIVNWGQGKHYVTYNGTMCIPDNKKINSKYSYYLLQSLYLDKRIKGSQPYLSISDFVDIKVAIPPLEEQERIVAILDRFDALCNDLTSGLPAEIEARKKQYEYYRDKLLTFKEAV